MPMLFFWHGQVAEGQSRGEVHDLLARTKEYARAHYPDSPVRIQLHSLGSGDEVWWFREHDSLAQRQQVEREMPRDELWRALENEWGVRFDDESATIAYLFPIGGAPRSDETKPVRWLRVTRSPALKLAPARQLAKRVVEHLEENYPGLDARAYAPDLHDPAQIYWMFDYESIDSWESIRRQVLEDAEYARLFEEADELFLEEALLDVFLSDF
jgi:hypothetical protein